METVWRGFCEISAPMKKACETEQCSPLVRLEGIGAKGMLKLFARTSALRVSVAWISITLLCVFHDMSG